MLKQVDWFGTSVDGSGWRAEEIEPDATRLASNRGIFEVV